MTTLWLVGLAIMWAPGVSRLEAQNSAHDQAAAPVQLAPEEGVLLLRNGEVLQGKISRAGDRYFVSFADGEIRIRADDVEMCCRTLTEGYQRKQAVITSGRADDHLNLAQWCIQHQLFEEGNAELAAAQAADPRHPRLAILQRAWQVAQQQESQPAPASTASSSGPSNEELDRIVRGMPAGTVETFTHSIQPLLLNHCATAGCHNPGAQETFSLARIQLGRTASRRLTQRNLFTVLGLLKSDNPLASPLLEKPLAAHGKAKSPVFRDQQSPQYRMLAAWVGEVYPDRRQAMPVGSVNPPRSVLLQTSPYDSVVPTPHGGGPAPGGIPVPGGHLPDRGNLASSGTADPAATTSGAASTAGTTPGDAATSENFATGNDPFDPEVFNRRYFGPSPAQPK